MESEIKNLFCTYINIHYIICDCGDTFPTEEELKEHLQIKHDSGNIFECINVPPITITNNAEVENQKNSAPKLCDKSGLEILFKGVKKSINTKKKQVFKPIKAKKEANPTDEVNNTLKMEIRDNKDSVIEILSHLLGKDFLPPRPTQRKLKELDNTIIAVTDMTFQQAVKELKKKKEKLGYKEAKYHCQYCYRYYHSEQKFQEHMLCHDEASGPIECEVCKIRVKSKALLDKHTSYMHTKKYSCKMCPFTSTYRSTALSHVDFHKGQKYKCPHCSKEFAFVSTRETHIRRNHPARYACALCGYTFITPLGVKTHTNKKHKFDGETPLHGPYCEECKMQFLSQEAYDRHKEMSSIHNKDLTLRRPNSAENVNTLARLIEKQKLKCYNCEVCGMELTRLKYMKHFRIAHEGKHSKLFSHQKPVQCEICGKTFKSASKLSTHRKTHDGSGPRHKCEECGRQFLLRGNLKLHQATHLPRDLRPTYKCHLCDNTFTIIYNLKRHLSVTHTGLKEFACDVCGKGFTAKSVLQGHINHVHLKIPRPPRAPRRQRIYKYIVPKSNRDLDQEAKDTDHEARNTDHEAMNTDHEARNTDHELRNAEKEISGPDYQVMGPDHEVEGPDHEVMGPDHEVIVPDHEVIVADHEVEMRSPDREIRGANRTEIRHPNQVRFSDSKISGPNRKTKSNDHEMRGADSGHSPRASKRRSDHEGYIKRSHPNNIKRGVRIPHEIQGLIIKSSNSNTKGRPCNEVQSVLVKRSSPNLKRVPDHERAPNRRIPNKERPHLVVRSTIEPRRPQHIQMRNSGHIDLSAYDHIDMLD